MGPADFVATYGGPTDQAAAATGLSRWAIVAQWGLETGWCAPSSGCGCSNLAGITCHGSCTCGGRFCCYPDAWAFASDYVAVLNNGYYAGVLATAGTTIRQQLQALGASPWDGGHYDDGGGPGSSLMRVYSSALAPISGIGLDDPLSAPAPGPPPPAPPPVPPPAPAGTSAGPLPLLLLAGGLAIAYAERRHLGALLAEVGALTRRVAGAA